MKKNVVDFEPHRALFVPDDDPILFYRAIIAFTEKYLKNKGRIYFEINEKMGSKVIDLLQHKKFQEVTVHQDINGKDRFVRAVKAK